MTAVASPPSQHPLPRWHSENNGGDTLDSMTAEEVHRLLIAPKKEQSRSDSGYTNGTPILGTPIDDFPQIDSVTSNEQGGWGPRKKAAKFWPTSKPEVGPRMPTAANQVITTPSSGQAAASTTNSLHQQSPLPSPIQAHMQPNGARSDYSSAQRNDPAVILELHPLTGTFERKRIQIPYFPDVQKIGRQTNAKTQPASNNGYFDSKVLSRQHAEVWAEKSGKVLIRDVKSSNGTFVNGTRLSQENKESEPHELREGDMLELGIDIVSEDQKSIVHHKVSAKVERAGLYTNSLNILDMMPMDPNTGQPILSDATSGQLSQLRVRGGSQGSIGNNSHISGQSNMMGNPNVLGAHKQMNMWMEPITVEKVVKRLTAELRQAKQQSHELHRTGDFFTTLLNLEPGQEPPKSPRKESEEQRQSQAISQSAPCEAPIPFSQPPAPPPSQPLPEKPDSTHAGLTDAIMQSGIKRVETEKPAIGSGSPTRSEPQNSQILSLLETLKSTKQELSSQSERMKYLENALKRERNAREKAERRAQALSGDQMIDLRHDGDGKVDEEAFEPPLDSVELMEQDLPNGHVDEENHAPKRLLTSPSMETLKDADSYEPETPNNEATNLQDRYELLKQEFDQAKTMMESYKRRAEDAEQSQRRFAELVENIRAGNNDHHKATSPPALTSTDTTLIGSDHADDALSMSPTITQNGPTRGLWSPPGKQHQQDLPNGNVLPPGTRIPPELEASLSRVLEQQQQRQPHGPGDGKWVQSAPYVSMVGVVLIGVGIMTWLNGWQSGGGGGGGGGGKIIE
ncbi:uncharacterized protein KY384_001128 [Bacidia gigantensis]|uniref:uncharacterized protein n=1 Tax=Bacidia gigantensis TaxID=2732470 RepID=UPI001D040C7B|nr:uncharacterized protein KY384_001128 [Bacidia gigantensis]KAG8534284.1 hypothetical protein KY384_001128 [Bacidia gigantensis]